MEIALIYVALCVLGYSLVQKRLASTIVTGPMIFAALGLLAGASGLGLVSASGNTAVFTVDLVLELTLALVLFTDAAALHFTSWRKDAELPGRLLGIGLPLTIGLGAAIAALVLTDLSFWEAAILGTIIAPTDAALGQAVISNPRVPARIRSALDVESGLNDGIALPFVLIFIALAEGGLGDTRVVVTFLQAFGVAAIVGAAVAALGGWLLVRANRAGWQSPMWTNIAVVALALIAFGVADYLGGSGFIAAFVAGMVYGEVTRGRLTHGGELAVDLGAMLTQVSFLLFGALLLGPAMGAATWQVLLMAGLGLTVVRMVPVAISLIGTKLKTPTVLYMGWFGPRGLSTIVYAALIVAQTNLPGSSLIVAAAGVTVGLSILAHGLTANPGANLYANWYQKQDRDKIAEGKKLHGRPEARPWMHVKTKTEPTAS